MLAAITAVKNVVKIWDTKLPRVAITLQSHPDQVTFPPFSVGPGVFLVFPVYRVCGGFFPLSTRAIHFSIHPLVLPLCPLLLEHFSSTFWKFLVCVSMFLLFCVDWVTI